MKTSVLTWAIICASSLVALTRISAQTIADLAILAAPNCKPNPITAGEKLSVTFLVKNLGTAATPPSATRIQIFTPGHGQLLSINVPTPAIVPGGEVPLSASITIPLESESGDYTAVAVADTAFQVNEDEIANNESPAGKFTVTAVPLESDVFLDGDIHITPDPVLAGKEIVVKYTIRNKGAAATSGKFQTRVLVKNPTEFQFILLDFPVPPLAAGQVSAQEHHIPLPGDLRSGMYSVRLRLDPFFDILNEGERFNDATDPFYFSVIAVQPDLLVKFAEVCPHSAHPGDKAQLNFTVFNESSSPAPAARNRLELTDPKSNQHVVSVYMTNSVIPPHGSVDYVFAFTVPAAGLPGRWGVSVFLNDFLDFAEADTFNNVNDPVVYLTVVAPEAAVVPCTQPLKLNSPRWINGRFMFDVAGSGSDSITVQSSQDLKTWKSAGPIAWVDGKGTFTAPDGPLGFFRATK